MTTFKELTFAYPYFVKYKENLTNEIFYDHWSERTLNEELARNEVTILSIQLSSRITEAFETLKKGIDK